MAGPTAQCHDPPLSQQQRSRHKKPARLVLYVLAIASACDAKWHCNPLMWTRHVLSRSAQLAEQSGCTAHVGQ